MLADHQAFQGGVKRVIHDILAANPGAVKEGAFNFPIRQVMKATRGKANPQLVNELLKRAIHAQ